MFEHRRRTEGLEGGNGSGSNLDHDRLMRWKLRALVRGIRVRERSVRRSSSFRRSTDFPGEVLRAFVGRQSRKVQGV